MQYSLKEIFFHHVLEVSGQAEVVTCGQLWWGVQVDVDFLYVANRVQYRWSARFS